MLKRLLFLFLILSLFTGCSGTSSVVPSNTTTTVVLPAKITLESVPMILDPSKVPPAPDLVANDATVAGVDSNNNGIRDDVERWIAQTYPTSAKMRAAVAQMALNSQKELTTPGLTKNSAYQIAIEGMDAIFCVGNSSDNAGLKWNIKDYMAIVYNTHIRFSALMSFQNTMGSRLFKAPKTNTCDILESQMPN